jgi:hypothetical protein
VGRNSDPDRRTDDARDRSPVAARKLRRRVGPPPRSAGQVEGHVNRLKLIKRAGYGRAGFDLLKARVLNTA